MSLVDFRYRRTKPVSPESGYFYWVDSVDDGTQIWFSPDSNPEHLILLNDKFTEEFEKLESLSSKITNMEIGVEDVTNALEEINSTLSRLKGEILEEVEAKGYLTSTDLDGYAKLEDLPEVPTKVSELENDADYLTDSDLDEYAKIEDLPSVPENVSELVNDAGYLTEDDLEDYAKKEDIHELDDSDYDIIAEKVNERMSKLTWTEIL